MPAPRFIVPPSTRPRSPVPCVVSGYVLFDFIWVLQSPDFDLNCDINESLRL